MSAFEKPRKVSRSKDGSLSFSAGTFSVPVRKSSPSVQRLNTNLMSKADFRPFSTASIFSSVKPLARKRAGVDGGRLLHGAVADRIGLDLGDLGLAVAERAQRIGHGPVDDLEVAAAGELLELHEREVGLDAGGVAIHHEADRAGGRDDGGLRVAVAVLLAELQGAVPGATWHGRRGPGRGRRRDRAGPG